MVVYSVVKPRLDHLRQEGAGVETLSALSRSRKMKSDAPSARGTGATAPRAELLREPGARAPSPPFPP